MTYRDDPDQAFAEAIAQGRLTEYAGELDAGLWMYMGTWDGWDQFKNSVTREYLPVPAPECTLEGCWCKQAPRGWASVDGGLDELFDEGVREALEGGA